MALSMRYEDIKQVPWFSLAEWHQVYKQIYSNDVNEQNKGYEMLLVWQARIPKLPVGVDCTLSIMQVCARDREWTPKINNGELPISYENDLCLMYSTTIMRFLNHISNIGHTKQTSLFQIAKQLNIPEWIVNLRHDTAHGHELPSIGVLRIAINILLVWLHEQYWAVEAKRMEEYLINEESVKEVQETEEVQDFDDLIELWTSVSLYIHAGYHLVSNVPDLQLKETLQDLRSYAISLLKENSEDMENDIDNYIEAANDDIKKDKKYTLETARIVLLSEISRFLNKKSIPGKKDIVCNTLLSSEVFLPNKDMLAIFSKNTENELEKNVLPLDMVEFWKDIIFLLCEKDLMEVLIVKLLELINNNKVNEEKKLLASLWISSISYSFLKLDIVNSTCRILEYYLEKMQKKLPPKVFELKVKEKVDHIYPHLKCVLWFNLSDIVLPCLTDIKFISKLILNINEFSFKFIVPILELSSLKIDNKSKHLLLNLMNVSMMVPLDKNDINSIECEKIFTLSDIKDDEYLIDTNNEQNKVLQFLADQKIRNNYWNFAVATHNWAESPIGLLPWQNDALEFVNSLNMVVQKYDVSVLDSEILPGIIDMKNVKIHGRINWNNVLRKKKRLKRKQDRRNINIIMNKALETVKKQK
ncbi:Ribosomal biogenesis protein LAS1L [Melipona quadrifasciata]|uniref:Ribosomal biogenesis protein LAS1L n=1 Tax=Melipona quadrifasciata TaxID=166423 RepID=A0A0M8ZSJ4_9HYME|nr:Ribosomal biogenesis protein LAS1L [Melipona quadrifasciata]